MNAETAAAAETLPLADQIGGVPDWIRNLCTEWNRLSKRGKSQNPFLLSHVKDRIQKIEIILKRHGYNTKMEKLS